jgi:integrase
MSVERVQRKGQVLWRARWRENGQAHSQVCNTKADARRLDDEIKRRKRLGILGDLDAGTQTVADFARDMWWPLHASHLAKRTRDNYACVFDAHLLGRVGAMRLRDVRSQTVARLRVDLEQAGVGPAAVRKALAVLSGIFTHAVAWEQVESNPVTNVLKPSATRARAIDPPAPSVIEAMRSDLLVSQRLRDATLISVLAYAGLRPAEALALQWRHVRERVLLIEQAQGDGEVKTTKTRRVRTVRLLGPLAADLATWRLASGRPPDEAFVFGKDSGDAWRDHDWKNWSRRVFAPLAKRRAVIKTNPYDLRHTFCSLLLQEGRSVVEVAAHAGHSPSMTLDTYAHVIAELDDGPRPSAEEAIRAAREGNVSEKCPPTEDAATG